MRITILGTGHVATVLGRLMRRAGHSIEQLYGRTEKFTYALARELGAAPVMAVGKIEEYSDLYLIAVSDEAIKPLVSGLGVGRKMLVHTAGSVPMSVLEPASKNYGVLYPLQSMRKEIETIPEIPFLVNANTPDNLTILFDFASTLSERVEIANDEQRRKLHLSAVIMNNFINYLATLTQDYCRREGVSFEWLFPLIRETAVRTEKSDLRGLQTGPAIRGDQETIRRHLEMLGNYPELKSLYIHFSETIQASGEGKK